MNFISGDLVTLRHFSSSSLIRSVITYVNGESITIKITKDMISLNFFEGDPVVVIYERDSNIYSASSVISNVSLRYKTITLIISNTELLTDKRQNERFSVSLYCDIRIKGNQKKEIAAVKNISSEGIMVCSKASFDLENELEVDMYIDNSLIFVKAEVVWKVNKANYFEYGLVVGYPSLQVKNLVKRQLQNLKDEQTKFIQDLKNEM